MCASRDVAGPTAANCASYGSIETHTWIQKAADLAGLGTDSIRWIPTDASLANGCRRAAPADRRRLGRRATSRAWSSARPARSAPARSIRSTRLRQSAGSMASGSTSTAPMVASRRPCPTPPTTFARLSLADSVAVDPHKWLYAPLEPDAPWCAILSRCAPRSPITRRTITSTSARPTTSTTARRTRVASARSRCGSR